MQKSKSIFKVAFVVTILVIIGKALGFVREMVIAGFYGSTPETDAYFLAQSMPGMLFPSVCNSISTAFIAIYSRKKTKMQGMEESSYVYGVLFILTLGSMVLSLIGVLLTPIAVTVFAPGFSTFQHELAVKLTLIVMTSFIVIMLQYFLIAMANANEEFVKVHIAALVYSVIVILMLVLNGNARDIYFLTYSVIVGQVIQVLILFGIVLGRVPLTIKISISQSKADVLEVVRMAAPILVSSAAYQINAIVDKILSSFLQEGTVSALSYSHTLTALVVSVFVTAISTVIYPRLSKLHAQGKIVEFKEQIKGSLIILEVILVPISIIVLFLAKDVVQVVYGRGSFDEGAINLTSNALLGYAFIFVGTGVVEILTRAFYAQGDSKTPIKATIIGIIINVVMSCIMFKTLGILGIAFGTTIGTITSAIIIFYDFNKSYSGDMVKSIYQILLIAMPVIPQVAILWVLKRYLNLENVFGKLVIYSVAGFLVYAGIELLINAELRSYLKQARSN